VEEGIWRRELGGGSLEEAVWSIHLKKVNTEIKSWNYKQRSKRAPGFMPTIHTSDHAVVWYERCHVNQGIDIEQPRWSW
jgi:hypothetical protein